jgi:hypothetical protein
MSYNVQVPKARDILPANVALNDKIGELRDRWVCPTPGGPCGSAHCYFNAINTEHSPLSHDHFKSWGAAMVSFIRLNNSTRTMLTED